ncbi:MAG: carboxypeptidase-like regulatory domain-containing protein, partial [Halobacteriales archaeon]|nr:carboxypeptidase-like regulatory domain-containing protein [Halobacteriales archaeon]
RWALVQGDPVPGVDVSIEQNPGGIIIAMTQTNGTGYYSFTGLPPGTYRLRIGSAPPPPRAVAVVSGPRAHQVDIEVAVARSLHADPGIEVVVGKGGGGRVAGQVRALLPSRDRVR